MQQIAIVGAGRIGRIHALNAQANPRLAVRYVVDPVEQAARELAELTGARLASYDELLSDHELTAVVVASSTDTHLDYSVRALAAGKVVFCEKPVDLDLQRARSAADAFAAANRRFFIGFNRRFDPHFRRLHDRLRSEERGTLETLHIISHDPAPPPLNYVKVSGGLFKDMSIHDFDMARWLMGEDPVEVYVAGAALVDAAIGAAGDIDTAKVVLRTASGKICVISNSRRSGYGYDQRIEAFCSNGMLRAGNVHASTTEAWDESGVHSDALQNFFLDRYADAYRAEMAHLADILTGAASPLIGYEDAVRSLSIAEAARLSLDQSRVVRIDY